MKSFIRKIVRKFRRTSNIVLGAFASKVYSYTSASKNLINPTPSMADLLVAITNFNAAMDATDMVSGVQKEAKSQAREALIALLDQLADWITLIARNDALIMAESGFELNKIPSARHILAPVNVTLSDGLTAGELVSNCDTVENATSYVHQISLDPLLAEDSWVTVTSTQKTYTHKNLQLGKTYYCRIASVGSKNQQYYSKVVSRIAQ